MKMPIYRMGNSLPVSKEKITITMIHGSIRNGFHSHRFWKGAFLVLSPKRKLSTTWQSRIKVCELALKHGYTELVLKCDFEAGGSLEVRSSRPAWPMWWNPVSTNNTKISPTWWCMPVISATSGGWARRIAWTREAEVVVSQDCAAALQPRWQSEILSQNK